MDVTITFSRSFGCFLKSYNTFRFSKFTVFLLLERCKNLFKKNKKVISTIEYVHRHSFKLKKQTHKCHFTTNDIQSLHYFQYFHTLSVLLSRNNNANHKDDLPRPIGTTECVSKIEDTAFIIRIESSTKLASNLNRYKHRLQNIVKVAHK